MADGVVNQELAVIALGGNAIIAKGEKGEFGRQFANTRKSMGPIVELMEKGYNFVLTHGNGPQVGAIMLQNEHSKGQVPEVPLSVADAMTCGSMGYMIEQSLQNELRSKNLWREVVTVPAQIMVDRHDPAMENPTKPIGPFYEKEEAEKLIKEKGWVVREDANRGYRRYVPSPYPLDIVEKEVIAHLLQLGYVVVTGGGGGIPVTKVNGGQLEGVDCVIDKDLASMKIALALGAKTLIIITGVPKVTLNFGKPDEKALDTITLAEARSFYEQGHFPAGSMGPKIRAAIEFVQASPDNKVIITDVDSLIPAVEGKGGTTIVTY